MVKVKAEFKLTLSCFTVNRLIADRPLSYPLLVNKALKLWSVIFHNNLIKYLRTREYAFFHTTMKIRTFTLRIPSKKSCIRHFQLWHDYLKIISNYL